MKYNGIAFFLCIAVFWSTLYGQETGKGWVISKRNLEKTEGLKFVLSLLPSDFDKLPDEIKVQIVHQMIVTMPLNDALQTLSSLASTNKDWYRISHDKTFDPYWALIYDKNLYKALEKRNLIKTIKIIQHDPALQNIDNHSWAIIFHKMIDYLPTDLIEKALNFALDEQAIADFRTKHGNLKKFLSYNGLRSYDSNAPEILYALILIIGADANFNGIPPLMGAVLANNPVVVRLLLDNGADINRKAADDSTALTLAAVHGYVDIVKLLLDYGADRVTTLLRLQAAKRSVTRDVMINLLKTYEPNPR